MDASFLFPLLIILIALPLFLSARKQKKAYQQMQQLQRSLQPGDRVMTTSGLYGTVVDSEDDETIDLELAPGVVTTWARAAVREKANPQADAATDVDGTEVDGTESAEQPTEVAADKGSAGAEVAPPLEEEKNRR
ncbi:preprotein translocase subunit YajC [Longimycelium tulufanense]|uniref:Preprotein translocase subunit YajC n=1 Tax=Longimycelium tulufanense TaxID=907463 RepID=A0A8J3FY01_9PSEU|nr:preprotein translocase subunit YajC [Longimycelium tulufanense]GGM72294.1 preprotein translocase subunit YajC [Longimycelium tulufanense]